MCVWGGGGGGYGGMSVSLFVSAVVCTQLYRSFIFMLLFHAVSLFGRLSVCLISFCFMFPTTNVPDLAVSPVS